MPLMKWHIHTDDVLFIIISADVVIDILLPRTWGLMSKEFYSLNSQSQSSCCEFEEIKVKRTVLYLPHHYIYPEKQHKIACEMVLDWCLLLLFLYFYYIIKSYISYYNINIKTTKLYCTILHIYIENVVSSLYIHIFSTINNQPLSKILTSRTVALVFELIQRRAPSIMKTRRRLTRHILRIAVSAGIPRLAYTGVRPVGIETTAVVTRARTAGATRTFDDVFGAARAGEAGGTYAGVAGSSGVVGDAAAAVAARLRCAMVFVGAF